MRQGDFHLRRTDDEKHIVGAWGDVMIGLLTQFEIGPYRCDFVLMSWFQQKDPRPWLVIVEADGHDFHERTKHQAARDRARDRYFQTRFCDRGAVLRFTGSEICRDVDSCAEQAFLHAAGLHRENLQHHFTRALAERYGKGVL